LISSGRADEELGDKLLPYVVVESVDDVARLKHLGVEELDDAASASPSALLRALALLGEQLSTGWGRKEILQVRSRWRLVRGAIQEMYRSLNQSTEVLECSPETRFAVRTPSGVEFCTSPLYYAEPGSTVEQAFLDVLPLFDADRTYLRLFERIGVARLIAGETVNEAFLAESSSVSVQSLRAEIAGQLAPYLLAPIIAKSDKSVQSETIVRRLTERFDVKAADRLTVSYSLIDDPAIERTIEFPKFYLQRRIVPGPGAIREAHYTLYIAGEASVSLFSSSLDADALGEALSPVFLEGIGDELAGLFPRVASRYHILQGRRDAMEEFLYYQLGISREAQDMAWAMISGEMPEAAVAPPPPPVRIVRRPTVDVGTHFDSKQALQEVARAHQGRIREQADGLILGLISRPKEEQTPGTSTGPIAVPQVRLGGPSPEQRQQGRTGEEEIKRRLENPGGWEGFSLVADTRDKGCGYDFLCAMEERQVKLEVKTFTPNGRVFVSDRELQEAAVSQDDYYLVGVLDDGKPANEWSTFVICNPIDDLLAIGEFDVQATLVAPAADVFGLEERCSGSST
jgi:hypothetical protein